MEKHITELKQQGALEAARDPASAVSAADAEKKVVDAEKAAGGAAFQFDPNATAQEKAAQIDSHVPAGFHHQRKPKVAALASDVDDGTKSKYDLPAASKAGAIEANGSATGSDANGHAPEDAYDWDRVGWAPRFGPGSGADDDEGNMLDHQTWLEGRLDDKFFGDWYHNTGIIIFACLGTWVIGILGGGLAWVFLIMAFCGTYYRTSIRRVRRNFRDDVNREMAKLRLETDTESLEWMNSFLVKFWPIYAPVLCRTIVSSVDQVLSTSTPAFLDSLRMKTFTLGTKPPRLEHVKTYPKSEDDIVLMDWKFSFNPNDTADMTARQLKVKTNPKIVLEVRVGKGVVSKGLDVIVEDMAFSGLMRVKCKLQIPFPHIDRVEMCFLGRPAIDYVCKPLGGDVFGFDINFIPGLEAFIMEQVHANLGPMMYDPNVFPIEVAKMLAGTAVDQAIGVLQITFHGAQGLKNPDKFSGTPDPYAIVSINGRQELGRTKTVEENANPRWNETISVIITSLKDTMTIQVYDYNEIRKDKELGTASFALERFEQDQEYENEQLEVMANGRARGVITADVRFFPVLEGAKLADGTEEPPPESLSGIAKFTVECAKELDGSKSLIGELNPYAVLLLNGKEVHISSKLKRTNNPIWSDATQELLITNRKSAKLGLVIKDDRGIVADPIIGTYQIKLDDMAELMAKGQEWYNLAGVKTGRAKMQIQWKPVALKGGVAGSGGYVTPIGVMRIHFMNARDLRNLETVGKSDPYARVLLSGIEKGKTVAFKNNLDPNWDEVVYVPIHSAREKLLLEVMDQEKLGKDRSLGHVEMPVEDYLRQQEDGSYLPTDSKELLRRPLISGPSRHAKGTLQFTCSFFPTENVADPDEEEEEARESIEGAPRKSGDVKKSMDTTRARSSTAGSLDLATKLANGEKEQQELAEITKEPPKIKLDVESLENHESGLIVFKLLEGQISQTGCHLQVLMDDMVFPSWTSSKIRSKHTTFNEVGDAMVRELDFSRITLRLVEEIDKKGEGSEEHIVAKLSGSTLDTLKRCLYTPTELILKDNDGRESKVTVSLKYLPVKMKLDPGESFNNMGTLKVDVMDGADLPAADRNGYSDPYCKFYLDGKQVYKTDTQKKTLHPSWNEAFETAVRSRTGAQFEVHVFDWDMGPNDDDFLGKAVIDLTTLEPFQRQEVTVGLDGKSGAVRLRMLFRPDYITRTRQGSSTFHGTFATPGKVIGAPYKGVGKGAVMVGGGVAKGASFIGRGFKRRKSRAGGEEMPADDADASHINGSKAPTVQVDGEATSPGPSTPVPHSRTRSWGHASSFVGGPDSGTALITVVSAAGYPDGSNVRVHVRMVGPKAKEVHKTKAVKAHEADSVTWADRSEEFKVSCTADTQFKVVVKDHSTFGSDDELGEGTFFVDDQGAGGSREVACGSGRVVLRSSFTPAETGGMSPKAAGSMRRGVFGTKRESRDLRDSRERSTTPNP